MRNKTKKLIGNLLIALLFLAVSCYIIFQFIRNNLNTYETDYATEIFLSDNTEVVAGIFKDEQLIESNVSGAYRYLARDGERVGKNDVLIGVYSSNADVFDFTVAESLKKDLELYQKSNISKGSTQANLNTIDAACKENYVRMLEQLSKGDYYKATAEGMNSLVYMNRRLISSDKVNNFNDVITSLTLRINELEGGNKSVIKYINADKSGYFFSEADGYEEAFNISALNSMTVEDFDLLTSVKPADLSANVVGKLCTEFEWYFACKVSSEVALHYTVGKSYDVTFTLNSDLPVRATLQKTVQTPMSGYALLVFKSTVFPEEFNFRRFQNVILNFNNYEGVRVPTEAVRVVDDETGVYVISGNKIEFRTIDIIYSSGIYYISAIDKESTVSEKGHKRLGVNETIIISGKEVYEGKAVN